MEKDFFKYLDETYFIAKSRKSRILLMHNDIWVDLTDYDLISLFCKMDETTVERLLCDLKEGYEGSWKPFRFLVDYPASQDSLFGRNPIWKEV